MKKPESLGYQPLPGGGRDRSPLDRPLQRRAGVSPMESARSGELRARVAGPKPKPGKLVAPGQPGVPGRDRERFVSLPDELEVPSQAPTIFEDLEQPQTGISGRISIYCVAEALDRKALEACLRQRGGAALLHLYPDVLYGQYCPAASSINPPMPLSADGSPAIAGGGLLATANGTGGMPGEVFYFDYGVVACWGCSRQQEREVLRWLGPFLVDKLPQHEMETDEFQFVIAVGEKPHIQNDTITINFRLAHDHLIKMSILHALAQSTKLSVYEARVMALVEHTKDLPELLATTGRVGLSRKRVAQLIGQVFIQKSAVNLLSTVLDTPEFFWTAPDTMQTLYKRVCEYIEYDNRVEVLNSRFGVMQDMLDMLRDHQNNSHTSRLEWVIIWLIVIECVVGLFECATILGWVSMGGSSGHG